MNEKAIFVVFQSNLQIFNTKELKLEKEFSFGKPIKGKATFFTFSN